MSSRWSYGPNGLREKPPANWWGVFGWPRWSDLHPVLLRSAGVVGLAGIAVALISSNAFVGNEPVRRLSAEAAIVRPAAELPPPANADEVTAAISDTPAELAPTTAIEVSTQPPAPPAVPPAPQLPLIAAAGTSSDQPPATSSISQPSFEAMPVTPEVVAAPEPLIVPPGDGAAAALPPPARGPAPPLAASEPVVVASIAASDLRRAEPEATSSIWLGDAAKCPRDWVGDARARTSTETDCQPTAQLIASLELVETSALEEAASQRAVELAALAPRVPLPRPEPPKDLPKPQPARASRSSSWPPTPPPDCGSQHAYWRFVDRKAGTKEWYCK